MRDVDVAVDDGQAGGIVEAIGNLRRRDGAAVQQARDRPDRAVRRFTEDAVVDRLEAREHEAAVGQEVHAPDLRLEALGADLLERP
ncbi:MAG: hypothetical protein ACYTGR_06325 [Planctomycetota bacterium]